MRRSHSVACVQKVKPVLQATIIYISKNVCFISKKDLPKN
jgi:hypothetical protein